MFALHSTHETRSHTTHGFSPRDYGLTTVRVNSRDTLSALEFVQGVPKCASSALICHIIGTDVGAKAWYGVKSRRDVTKHFEAPGTTQSYSTSRLSPGCRGDAGLQHLHRIRYETDGAILLALWRLYLDLLSTQEQRQQRQHQWYREGTWIWCQL